MMDEFAELDAGVECHGLAVADEGGDHGGGVADKKDVFVVAFFEGE